MSEQAIPKHALDATPAPQREAARAALAAVFGPSADPELRIITGGASGALVYRAAARGRTCVLRLETRRDARRNPHQYECLRIAADAGVAPPVFHLDAEAGVVAMAFVAQRPLADYPGGPTALARGLGRLAARLQVAPRFPALHEYSALLGHLVTWLEGSGIFAAGLLEPHRAAFERIREAYPWNASEPVSSHNDPNPRNVLFDGERLWLVDWETSYRNDPLTDVAILADQLAPSPELEAALLEAWLGRVPERELEARLHLMKLLTRLYYAALLFGVAASRRPPAVPAADLAAPTPEELAAAAARGELAATSPDTLYALGRMMLARFRAGVDGSRFEEALRAARAG